MPCRVSGACHCCKLSERFNHCRTRPWLTAAEPMGGGRWAVGDPLWTRQHLESQAQSRPHIHGSSPQMPNASACSGRGSGRGSVRACPCPCCRVPGHAAPRVCSCARTSSSVPGTERARRSLSASSGPGARTRLCPCACYLSAWEGVLRASQRVCGHGQLPGVMLYLSILGGTARVPATAGRAEAAG